MRVSQHAKDRAAEMGVTINEVHEAVTVLWHGEYTRGADGKPVAR